MLTSEVEFHKSKMWKFINYAFCDLKERKDRSLRKFYNETIGRVAKLIDWGTTKRTTYRRNF